MAYYDIVWKHSAEKDLRKIDGSQIPKIIKAVELLSKNPVPPGVKKLVGSERAFRIRVGDYRVIYQFDIKEKLVIIEHVRHRKEAYR